MPDQFGMADIQIGACGRWRRISRVISLLLCWLLTISPFGAWAQSAAEPAKQRIAVLAFELIDVKKAEGIAAEDQLRNELVKKRIYTVVDRAQTDKVLKELAFQQVGLTEQDKALELGKLLNVQLIVTGRLTALTGAVQLNVQMIEVQTAEILRSESLLHRGDMLGLIAEKVPLVATRLTSADKAKVAAPKQEPQPDLKKLADATPLPEEKEAAPQQAEEEGGMPWWGWALIGLGAAVATSSSDDSTAEPTGSVSFSY